MPKRMHKRNSAEIDKLIAKVEDLVQNKGYSVNRACHEVGLQTTVYYFRKRKEAAEKAVSAQSSTKKLPRDEENKSLNELKREFNETKERLAMLKKKIVDATLADLNLD